MRQSEFLAQVRKALAEPQTEFTHSRPAALREWARYAELAGDYGALAEIFERELDAVGGFVHRVESEEQACERMLDLVDSAKMVGVSESARAVAGVETTLTTANIALAQSRLDLEQAEAGISGAVCAIAETGTIVITSGSGESRLAPLLPPKHIVLLRAEQLVPNATAAMRLVRDKFSSSFPANVTFVTGPSRTADIELSLTIGVHGPGVFHVVMIGKEEGKSP